MENQKAPNTIKVNGVEVETFQSSTEQFMSMLRLYDYVEQKAQFGMISGIIGFAAGIASLILVLMR